MSYTVSLQQRIQQLKKIQGEVSDTLYDTAKKASERAVEAAMDATPPKAGTGAGAYKGTNTVTGALKQSWATASKTDPVGGGLSGGSEFITVLANDMEYASYVDQGHRLDRHFVPGLYVNPYSGLLEYEPDAEGLGLVVGTKTKYVKGEFMVDKAKEAYEKATLQILDKEIARLLK